jgi:hypothetical protein
MYVHVFMKYAEGNQKMKDLEVAMNNVKKLRPRRLGAKWPRNID